MHSLEPRTPLSITKYASLKDNRNMSSVLYSLRYNARRRADRTRIFEQTCYFYFEHPEFGEMESTEILIGTKCRIQCVNSTETTNQRQGMPLSKMGEYLRFEPTLLLFPDAIDLTLSGKLVCWNIPSVDPSFWIDMAGCEKFLRHLHNRFVLNTAFECERNDADESIRTDWTSVRCVDGRRLALMANVNEDVHPAVTRARFVQLSVSMDSWRCRKHW